MYPIENSHYDFKRRINKVDSLQNINFYVEQIDAYLNEALFIFIEEMLKLAEIDQNVMEALSNLIESEHTLLSLTTEPLRILAQLPTDYYRLLNSYSYIDSCKARINHYPIQHDDINAFLTDPNYKPSLLWRETGYQLEKGKIIVWTNGEFSIDKVVISYIKRHPRLGNPNGSRNGAYNLPDGTPAQQQGLLLDNKRQYDIIADIAVLNASIDTSNPDYQIKLNKILQNYVSK